MKVNKAFNKAISSYRLKSNDDWFLAGKSLLEFVSFRINYNSAGYRKLLWSTFKNTLKEIIVNSGNNNPVKLNGNSPSVILDCSLSYIELRENYVKTILGGNPGTLFCKNNLIVSFGIKDKFSLLSYATWLFTKFYFKKTDVKTGKNFAFLLREIVENYCLFKQLKSLKVKMLYDFSNYEVDSNVMYLLCKENGIAVYKIPSPGPLINHNSILLTDYLIVSSGYHLEELQDLEDIKYKKLIKAMPEMSPLFFSIYKNNNDKADKHSLAYYSHGSWLRLLAKDSDVGLNTYNGEIETLKLIGSFLEKFPQFKLTIYLHPRERKPELANDTMNFYSKWLPKDSFNFSMPNEKTTESFTKSNLAIVSLSTILFERLFIGKKTLICSKGLANFPRNGSLLENITFNKQKKLESLVLENYELDDKVFFDKMNLNTYLFTNFICA